MGACSADGNSPTDPNDPSPAQVRLSESALTMRSIGETRQIGAIVFDQVGRVLASEQVTWASQQPAVATVSSDGTVTAVGDGLAVVTATAGTASGSVNVTVAQEADSVVVTPSSLLLAGPGATDQLSASVWDALGHVIPSAAITFTSADTAIASVAPDGTVTAVATGATTVSASSGSVSTAVPVTVS